MMEIMRLIRPWQWVKNLFVFLPMFFSGRLADSVCWLEGFAAFFAMSFVASAVYCINDILDVEENRLHPRKKFRPLAAGTITVGCAWTVCAIMIVLSGGIVCFGFTYGSLEYVSSVIGAYLILNVAYCIRLKKIAILDVFCIALGFVLRLFLGGVACGIWVSPWIVCLTFLLTLFLAFAKRRDDVLLNEEGIASRKSVSGYNIAFMNQTLGLLGAITMVCYIIYTVQPEVETRFGTSSLYFTAVFVLAGILRYLQIALVNEKSGNPTSILLHDRFIQICVAGWILSFLLIIYL